MNDIGKELYERVRADFERRLAAEKHPPKDMRGVSDYSARVGRYLAEAIAANVTEDALPDRRLYYNIAESILEPSLRANYELVNDTAAEVQRLLDERQGLRIKPARADYPEDRVHAVIGAASEEGIEFDRALRRMTSPAENITQSFADDFMQANAAQRSRAGFDTFIERQGGLNCCPWCAGLVGVFAYPKGLPKEVFARHDNCTCSVTYGTKGGARQNVWSKQTWSSEQEREYLRLTDEAKRGNGGKRLTPKQIAAIREKVQAPHRLTKEQAMALGAFAQPRRLTGRAASDIIYTSELGSFKRKIQSDERIDEGYYGVLKSRFSRGSDLAKKAFNKYVIGNSVADSNYMGTPHFWDKDKKIYMNYLYDLYNPRGSGVTWFHEHGHFIDTLAGELSKDQDFISLLHSDYNNTVQTYMRKYKVDEQGAYALIGKDISDMRKHSAVSDLLNGLSGNKIVGISKHEPKYWENDSVFGSEAFAHMYESQFDEIRYKEMKRFFPNALQKFESILGGALT